MGAVTACTFQVIGSFYQSCWEFTFFSFVTSVFIIVCWKIFSVAALKSLSDILTSVRITPVLSCHWCVLTLFSNLSWNTPGSWYDTFSWNLHVWGMWWHYGSYLKVCYSRRLPPPLWWGKDSLIIAWQGWKCRFLARFCWPMMGGEGQKELVIVGEGGNSGSSVYCHGWEERITAPSPDPSIISTDTTGGRGCLVMTEKNASLGPHLASANQGDFFCIIWLEYNGYCLNGYCLVLSH